MSSEGNTTMAYKLRRPNKLIEQYEIDSLGNVEYYAIHRRNGDVMGRAWFFRDGLSYAHEPLRSQPRMAHVRATAQRIINSLK